MKGIIGLIGENASRIVSKAAFKVKKATPELLIIGGIGCIVGGTIMACKANNKIGQIADECKEEIDIHKSAIEENKNDPALVETEKKEIVKVKLHKAKDICVEYGPAIGLIIAGSCMVFKADRIFRSNEKNLIATINALDIMHRKYRENVRASENGDEKDKEYVVSQDKTDKNEAMVNYCTQTEYERMQRHGYNSPYVYEFSRFTSPWFNKKSALCENDVINLDIVRQLEEQIRLWRRYDGHVFLNKALNYIKIDEEPEGQIFGWIDPNKPIVIKSDVTASAFDPSEPAIRLEFNCDGVIIDKI